MCEAASIDIALTFEEKCRDGPIASLTVLSSVSVTCVAPEDGLAVESPDIHFEYYG